MAATMYGLSPAMVEGGNHNTIRQIIERQNLKAAGTRPADLAEAGNLAGFGSRESVGSGRAVPRLLLAR